MSSLLNQMEQTTLLDANSKSKSIASKLISASFDTITKNCSLCSNYYINRQLEFEQEGEVMSYHMNNDLMEEVQSVLFDEESVVESLSSRNTEVRGRR